MMKKTFRSGITVALVLFLIPLSCVPSRKYVASEDRAKMLQGETERVQSQLKDCNAKATSLAEDNTKLNGDISSLQNEYSSVKNDMQELSSESKLTIADQAKRLKSLQDIVQSQKEVMTSLKNSITDALLNYQTDELTVYIKEGKVYVSLEEKLLFKSGSDVVDLKGKEALKTLTKVLKGTSDITVMIEGHTDNIPIKTKQFEDNWDLSTARATSILRIITRDNGFDPNRITASGKGQFHPVKTNETLAGRAANRRTEIILSPDLKEIYKLLL